MTSKEPQNGVQAGSMAWNPVKHIAQGIARRCVCRTLSSQHLLFCHQELYKSKAYFDRGQRQDTVPFQSCAVCFIRPHCGGNSRYMLSISPLTSANLALDDSAKNSQFQKLVMGWWKCASRPAFGRSGPCSD